MAKRVCIVSVGNTYVKRSGNSNYLDHMARLLRASGCDLHFLVMTPLRPEQARVRVDADYLAPYAGFSIRGALRLGRQFLSLDPSAWVGRIVRRLRPRPRGGVTEVKPWTLPEPDAAGLDWAARRVAALGPDLVIANYFNAAALFDRLAGPRKAILVHDVLALRAESSRQAGVAPEFDAEILEREARAFAGADACLAIQDAEAAFLRARHPGLVVRTAPYAVDIPDTDLEAPRAPVCLFVGSMSEANRDALLWLLSEIWPAVEAARPGARLRVLGAIAGAVDVAWPVGAEKVGYVEDLAAEYAGARVALAPLRFGSGMKIKVVEGLAHGLPTVATSVGVEGLAVAPPAILRVADDAEGFAAAVADALSADLPALRCGARAFAAAHHARAAAGRGLLEGIVGHA
jgi:succinoglycan biosynthesis protein ExoO